MRHSWIMLEDLDDGKALGQLEDALSALEKECFEYARMHGSAAKGVSGELVFRMRIECTKSEDGCSCWRITSPQIESYLRGLPPIWSNKEKSRAAALRDMSP